MKTKTIRDIETKRRGNEVTGVSGLPLRLFSPAFTLIELLVVVTIIVVLLALLLPAMDQAIYQAELTLCGAKQKALGTAINTYAADQKRSYPRRSWVQANVNERPILLSYLVVIDAVDYEDRSMLRPYFSINATLNCPLTKAVGLEPPDTHADTSPYSTYGLWFGYRFKGQRGLFRVSDRLQYLDDRFDVLAGDWDGMYEDTQSDISTHPDRDGVMADYLMENYPFLVADAKASYSFWQSAGNSRRGLVDLNYTFTDGSVVRFSDVKKLDRGPERDLRMANLPGRLEGADGDIWRAQIPIR